MLEKKEQGLGWELFAFAECSDCWPDRLSELCRRDELVFLENMENAGQHVWRQLWLFEHIHQGRDYLPHKSLFLEFIKHFHDVLQELYLLRVFFLVDVLQVADRFEERVLEPLILNVLP